MSLEFQGVLAASAEESIATGRDVVSASRSHHQANAPWTCRYIEAGLVFYGHQLKACCVTHHRDRGHLVLVEKFDGTELPLDALFRAREAALHKLQEPGGIEACSGCVMLTRQKPVTRRYPFDFIDFVNHFGCNLTCMYCIPRNRGLHERMRSVRVFPAVKQLADHGLLDPRLHVDWSGGEPMLAPDFAETSSFMASIGATQALFTNAVVLSEVALAWIPDSLSRMYVSVDAGTRETYRRIKGRDAFETVWAHIKRYVQAGGRRVLAKMVLLPENRHEVARFVQRAEDAGVQTVVVDINHFREDVGEDDVAAAAAMLEECARRGIRMQAGLLVIHGRPEEHFDERVTRSYEERLKDRTPFDRLVQRVGTAKALRHILRLSRTAFR